MQNSAEDSLKTITVDTRCYCNIITLFWIMIMIDLWLNYDLIQILFNRCSIIFTE